MKKQYKSSVMKNTKITKNLFFFFYEVPLKGYIDSKVFFRFGARNTKKALREYPVPSLMMVKFYNITII